MAYINQGNYYPPFNLTRYEFLTQGYLLQNQLNILNQQNALLKAENARLETKLKRISELIGLKETENEERSV